MAEEIEDVCLSFYHKETLKKTNNVGKLFLFFFFLFLPEWHLIILLG